MEFENIIINNIEIKGFHFKSIEEVNQYRFMTETDKAIRFAQDISLFIRIIDHTIIYYYSYKKKLWVKISNSQYISFCYDWFNESSKITKILLKKYDDIDDEVVKNTKEILKKFDNETFINNMIKRSFERLLNTDFIKELDGSKNYFPIKGGNKINLETLEVSSRTMKDYFTYESNVEFLPGSTPNADKFFSQIMSNKDNREFLRKVLGYTLTAETCARKFFVWYGFGANGKSKVFKLMELILKQQNLQCDKSIFVKSKTENRGASPEKMSLMGVRNAVLSEIDTTDNIEMNVGGIKQITGEDQINARGLFSSPVNFFPYCKLHLLTNFTPPTGADKAIVDRLIYIFMDSEFSINPDKKKSNQFKIDKDFTDKLETVFLSEVFSWIAKGAKEFYKTKSLEMTPDFTARTEAILLSDDSIKSFIERKIIKSGNDKDSIKKTDLFEAYKSYSNESSKRCQPRSTFFTRLDQIGIHISPTPLHGYEVYRGIKIETQEHENLYPELDGKTSREIELEKIVADLKKQLEQLSKPKKEEVNDYKEVFRKPPTDDDLEAEFSGLTSTEQKPNRIIIEDVDSLDDLRNIEAQIKKQKKNKKV